MIRKFRNDLLAVLTDNGWDDRLVEMVKRANQVENDLLKKQSYAVSRLLHGERAVSVRKVSVPVPVMEQQKPKEIMAPPPSTPIVLDKLEWPLGLDQDISLGFWEGL